MLSLVLRWQISSPHAWDVFWENYSLKGAGIALPSSSVQCGQLASTQPHEMRCFRLFFVGKFRHQMPGTFFGRITLCMEPEFGGCAEESDRHKKGEKRAGPALNPLK